MSFADRIAAYQDRVERALERWLPPAAHEPARLHEAMRYAVLGGGKRIRPLLVYATGETLGLAAERLDGAAAALEIVHAYPATDCPRSPSSAQKTIKFSLTLANVLFSRIRLKEFV